MNEPNFSTAHLLEVPVQSIRDHSRNTDSTEQLFLKISSYTFEILVITKTQKIKWYTKWMHLVVFYDAKNGGGKYETIPMP